MDLITLGPECPSLKAMGQKISREHLSPLDIPRQKPWLYQSSSSAVPASIQPLGHQCSPASLLHGGAMPVPRLRLLFISQGQWGIVSCRMAKRWLVKEQSRLFHTPGSCGLGTWLVRCCGQPAAWVLCTKLGCPQARSNCSVLSSELLILLILPTQHRQLLHTLLRRQWLHLARVTRQKLA